MTRILLALLFGLFSAPSLAANNYWLAREPTLNETHIVFTFAGDLWKTPRSGGHAVRLTSGSGTEHTPVFSPDGRLIAFTGEYDGNVDVFVVDAEGGVPRRLTWHPASDTALSWTPDGKRVLFTSDRETYSRFSQLFTIGLDGGPAEKVPLPMGYEGSYSEDGSHLAYVPIRRANSTWKRYRGGMATPIWVADLSDSSIQKIPREGSNDNTPMWVGDRIYFLSDRDGPFTLYCYETESRRVSRLIDNRGLDFKSASAGPGAIVYEQFGGLHLYDLKSGETSKVEVRIRGDFPEVRPHFVAVGRGLNIADVSPNGVRAVFEARGEIVTVPAKKGAARNLTNTTGVMERYPVWSPKGGRIAYFSDESGEYALHVSSQDGRGEVVKIPLGEPAYYASPRWSPDGKKIAYTDSRLTLWYVDLEERKPVKVDHDLYYPGGDLHPVWSPDGQWLAYGRQLENYLTAVFVYSLAEKETRQVTDGLSDARYPAWDRSGKYLYFTASTDVGPSLQPDLHSIRSDMSRSVYLAVLSKDEDSPFTPESDEEKAAEKESEEKPEADPPSEQAKGESNEEQKEKAPEKPAKKDNGKDETELRIDFENLDQRILAVPTPARRYVGLTAGVEGEIFLVEAPPRGSQDRSYQVHRYSLKMRQSDQPFGGLQDFALAHNGKKALLRQGNNWKIASVPPLRPQSGSRPSQGGLPGDTLGTSDIRVKIDPRAEWKQMFHEAWRYQRDFFYDPNHHGLDLSAAEERYEPYLENLAAREDLNYLFSEMLGEMTVGHLRAGGGDLPGVRRVPTGLLGADYEVANGRYRFKRVYDGENWNPELKAPLTQPGVNVVAGEYLLAVNGQSVAATDNLYRFFEQTVGKPVVLRVGPDPDEEGSREVTVVPVAGERGLRNLAWIEGNRRWVSQATDDRVAYIYMPDTSFGGITSFNRYFYAQAGKDAAIVDERFNGGGLLATDIVEILGRDTIMSKVATRYGRDSVQPQGAVFGPKVMLINEYAGSGGDAMPWYFKRAGVGKLIGKRTWGGLVGRAGTPPLMDGGRVSSPTSAVYNPHTGQWEVENVGVSPDIEVEFDPALCRQGRDPQLEKAVQVILEELKNNPPAQLKRPEYPNYHRRLEPAGSGGSNPNRNGKDG